jgi:hypothetical protein
MANGKSNYQTLLAAAATALHTRPNKSLLQTQLRGIMLEYTGLATELNSEYVSLGVPGIEGARFIPELFKVRHAGSGNFSVPIKFVKTTMVDGIPGVSKFDCTWTRSTTTCTVTCPQPHGFSTNQHLAVTNSSATTPVPNGGTGIITVLSATTFSFTCTNSGATSGTATFAEVASAQRAVTWSRTTTTLTVTTQGAHGYASNDILDMTAMSSVASLAVGLTGVITVTGATTFTIACTDAGDASGTATMGPQDGNSVPLTSSVAYTQAAIYTGAGVATVSNGVTGLGPSPTWRKTDELRLVWGVITTVPPVTRLFHIEGVCQAAA